MKAIEFQDTVDRCSCMDYQFHVLYDNEGFALLYASYVEVDTVTGEPAKQTTRKWWMLLSDVTTDQIVSTAFKCIMTSMEHRTREWFLYRGAPIYQPHQGVEALLAITPKR